MALSDTKILAAMDEGSIVIEPFSRPNLATSSYDVTLGEYFFSEKHPPHFENVFNPYDKDHVDSVWGVEPLRAKKAKDVFARNNIDWKGIHPEESVILMAPGETILGHTNEFIGGRDHITTMMKARSSLGRSFISVCKCAGWGDVGYINRWTMEIQNTSNKYYIPLVVGRRIAQIIFFETGPILAKSYFVEGKYQTDGTLAQLKKNWKPHMMLPQLYRDRDIKAGADRFNGEEEKEMKQYNDILKRIVDEGVDREGRNGKTRALFAIQMRFPMGAGFPAVTTKKLAFKAVKSELLWFLAMKDRERASDEMLKELNQSERTIWTDNAEADYWSPKSEFKGDLGRVYGIQWRNWKRPDGTSLDQIARLVENLQKNPYDRRHIVTAWNPGELEHMALPPCHMFFQCFVANGKLSLHMVQRSCDMFLGVPFNIASYSLLLHMLARATNLEAHEAILTLQDAHIYHEHFDAVNEQLAREPMQLPTLWLNPEKKDIDSFVMDDIRLENYVSHPSIKAKMIV